jgi:hypothetical protein
MPPGEKEWQYFPTKTPPVAEGSFIFGWLSGFGAL